VTLCQLNVAASHLICRYTMQFILQSNSRQCNAFYTN